MNFVIYAGIFMAGFLTLLLWAKREKEVHDYILMVWMVLSAVNLFFFFYNFNYGQAEWLWLQLLGALVPYLVAPWLYFYVESLVRNKPFKLRHYWWHFLPFIIQSVTLMYYYFYGSEAYQIWVADGFIQMRGPFPRNIRMYGLILAFFSFIYPTWSVVLLTRHRKKIGNEFSYSENINLNWLRYWILCSLGAFFICFFIIWAGEWQWVDFLTSFKTVAGLITVNIAVIGFYGVKQTTIFSNIQQVSIPDPAPVKAERYATSKIEAEEAGQLVGKLKQHMEGQQPYLDSQLSLEGLAGQVGMTKHDLSQLINDQLNTNFFGFVNDYRIEAFKERLTQKEYEHYTLLGIALETGFNSKSSFNSIFKKAEGITPSAYKKQIQSMS